MTRSDRTEEHHHDRCGDIGGSEKAIKPNDIVNPVGLSIQRGRNERICATERDDAVAFVGSIGDNTTGAVFLSEDSRTTCTGATMQMALWWGLIRCGQVTRCRMSRGLATTVATTS
jgi:hypothetical protein